MPSANLTVSAKWTFPAKWTLAKCLLLGAAALALSGCKTGDQPSAALPPIAQGAPLVNAPTADSLPPAPAVPVSEVADAADTYAFPDRAYEMSATFGEAPPDYVYDYDNVQPWVWVSDDGSECVVEPVPGGERYYYYEAGADQPFFVEDSDYGYGFEDGRLVGVYDRSGRTLPMGDLEARAPIAGRYLMRARSLYDASRQDRRQPVAESNWTARRGMIDAQRQAWQRQMTEDPNWRSFHAQNAPAVEAHWQGERVQRLNWAAHVDETMHNQADAVRERQQAQSVAASRPAPSSSNGRFAAAPRPAVIDHGAAPNQARQAPPEQMPAHFAQHPPVPQPTQAQARPQTTPRENFAGRQAPTPQPQAAPPQHMATAPRHEPPPQQQRAAREAPPQPQAAPPQQHVATAPRHEPPPQQQRAAREAPPQPQAAPPQQHVAMAPRHEPPPQQQRAAPPTPQPQAAPPPAQPHAAPPPHQQTAAAVPDAHPKQNKDDKHKQ